ncbi:MAG: M23 family peptidase [Fluviicola sp. XM-24bin1]|nr:MAG: M23 family peptidase [Fluviicola sp. XM-24bin1]
MGCTLTNDKVQKFEVEEEPPQLIADGFDYPVGKPDARGYYNAQPFGKNTHLGDDWNGVRGGDSDLGDPIYNIAHGKVVFAEDWGRAWGNVIRIVHYLPDSSKVESLYAHCDTIMVSKGDWIRRGTQIGTIGNNHGAYTAHLHLEMRDDVTLPIGKGYSSDTKGYLDPTEFIKNHRKLD